MIQTRNDLILDLNESPAFAGLFLFLFNGKQLFIFKFLGTGEFVPIAFVFLLLFGPDKIPGLARNLGKEFVELRMLVMILNTRFMKVQRV